LAINHEKNKQHTSRINTNGAQAGFRKWQSAEFKGGNQPNQNCNKNSIVAVTPDRFGYVNHTGSPVHLPGVKISKKNGWPSAVRKISSTQAGSIPMAPRPDSGNGNQLNSKVAISLIKIAKKIQLWRSHRKLIQILAHLAANKKILAHLAA
jgi:hypothetical protein